MHFKSPVLLIELISGLTKLMLVSMALSVLSGCGNSDKAATDYINSATAKKIDKKVQLKGEVSDNSGPVAVGTVKATQENGQVIVTGVIQDDGRYTIDLPAGVALPVILKVTLDEDPNSQGPLLAVVIDTGIKTYDINRLTTAIAKKAKALGGYNYANLSQAAMTSTSVPNSNQTTGGFSGDPTRQYGGWH